MIEPKVYEVDHPPHAKGYAVRWPFYGGNFNMRDYKSHQNLLNDIEEIWRTVIRDGLDIDPKTFKVRMKCYLQGLHADYRVGIFGCSCHSGYMGSVLRQRPH